MRQVASHLQNHALSLSNTEDRDKFARSSFNRYYYATFLVIRATLVQIDPKWALPKHSELPVKLRTSVIKKIKTQAKKGLLPAPQTNQLVSAATTAASELASLIEEGTRTRVAADYNPELAVVFNDSVISLNNVKISTAASWPIRADRSCGVILNVAKKFGLC